MTSLFLREPTYITVDQVKDTTSKTDLKTLSNDEIKILIAKAEDTIDDYIWNYWKPFNENQELIFPIDIGWVSTIPKEITIATFYTVEKIFENWDLITSATSSWWEIIQEKTWDRTIQYSEWITSTNILEIVWIPTQAKVILDKYKQIFFKSVI